MARTLFIVPLLALSLPLGAQGASAKPPASKGHLEVPKGHPEAAPATPATSTAANAQDELMTVRATPYRPTLVRDPFSAPTDAEQTSKGDLVDDIAVKGRVSSRGQMMAVVSDARGNIRTLGIGYRFRDGQLVAIDDKTVTFHQWDATTTNTRVFRTVVKTYKREEGKR